MYTVNRSFQKTLNKKIDQFEKFKRKVPSLSLAIAVAICAAFLRVVTQNIRTANNILSSAPLSQGWVEEKIRWWPNGLWTEIPAPPEETYFAASGEFVKILESDAYVDEPDRITGASIGFARGTNPSTGRFRVESGARRETIHRQVKEGLDEHGNWVHEVYEMPMYYMTKILEDVYERHAFGPAKKQVLASWNQVEQSGLIKGLITDLFYGRKTPSQIYGVLSSAITQEVT